MAEGLTGPYKHLGFGDEPDRSHRKAYEQEDDKF